MVATEKFADATFEHSNMPALESAETKVDVFICTRTLQLI